MKRGKGVGVSFGMVQMNHVQIVEAVYENGVLRPQSGLRLSEHARVRITVELTDAPTRAERDAAMRRFEEGVRKMAFKSSGPYPSRDELHERH